MRYLVCIVLFSWALVVAAADTTATRELEAAWRSAVDLDGEVIALQAGDDTAVAIHRRPADNDILGGVVLIHGPGTNADSHAVVRPLRIGLADAGWDTLSIQLPAAYDDATSADWHAQAPMIEARLGAALDWLRQRGIDRSVVIGVGESGRIALRFATSRPADQLVAVIMVGSPAGFDSDEERKALGDLARPLLDLYAERDRADVLDNLQQRATAVRDAKLEGYTQRAVAGATADFRGLDDALLSSVRAWLQKHAVATDAANP